jgi:hypothetical protein
MEVILTAVLVVLTGYTFVHPSVDNGAFTPIVLEGKMYRMNTRDGTWDICTPPTMRCEPTTLQTQEPLTKSAQNQ